MYLARLSLFVFEFGVGENGLKKRYDRGDCLLQVVIMGGGGSPTEEIKCFFK